MIAPRKWVHLLLILSELLIIAAHIIVCVMYGKYTSPNWNQKIWMSSKIKTINNLMKENNNNIYPILEVESNSSIVYNKNYKYLLEHSSTSKCKENYKKCGILDSMGNIMCIPNEDQCPINDLIVDSRNNQNNLLNSKYNVCYPEFLKSNNEALYSSNKATDKGIIIKIVPSNETQYIINPYNFIFDNDMYQSYKKSSTSSTSKTSSWWPSWSWPSWTRPSWNIPKFNLLNIKNGGGGGFRRLGDEIIYGDPDVTNFIFKKFYEPINIDKTFRNISNKINAGYYLGFKDIDSMNKFANKDFYNFYFERYPNVCSFVFTIILFVIFSILIIYSLTKLCHKDVDNEEFDRSDMLCGKLCIIIPYTAFFIGFFIYFTVKYTELYKRKEAGELINIKADPFLEDYLKEINAQIPKGNLTLSVIILYVVSICIHIFAWFLSHRFARRYTDLLEKTTQLTSD